MNFSEVEMPSQVGEFCIDEKKRKCRYTSKIFKKKTLFMRGFESWIGFNDKAGNRAYQARKTCGKREVNFFGSFLFGLDGLISFSIFPLELSIVDLISSIFSVIFSSCNDKIFFSEI